MSKPAWFSVVEWTFFRRSPSPGGAVFGTGNGDIGTLPNMNFNSRKHTYICSQTISNMRNQLPESCRHAFDTRHNATNQPPPFIQDSSTKNTSALLTVPLERFERVPRIYILETHPVRLFFDAARRDEDGIEVLERSAEAVAVGRE